MWDIAMEEKKKRTRSLTEKGRWFLGLEPFTESQRSMIAEWYPYAMKYADTEIKRRKNDSFKIPDSVIEDASVVALMYAVERWNAEGGKTFKSYFHTSFCMRVSNACRRYMEKCGPVISENVRAGKQRRDKGSDGAKVKYLSDTDLFSDKSFEDSILSDIYVEDLLSRLPPLQRTAVIRCCFNNERQSDVARSIGTTKQNINHALILAYQTIRRIMNGEIDRPIRGRRREKEEAEVG